MPSLATSTMSLRATQSCEGCYWLRAVSLLMADLTYTTIQYKYKGVLPGTEHWQTGERGANEARHVSVITGHTVSQNIMSDSLTMCILVSNVSNV